MGYISTPPATSFETVRKDRFTGLTTNYVTLTYAITTVDEVVCWVNAVKQDYTNLSLTGTTQLNLGGTLVSGDIVEVLFVGKTMQSVSPLADSVGNTQLNDEAVNEAKIQISNAGTNGQYLQKQSGNTGGLTWASVSAGDNKPTFRATANNTQTTSDGSWAKLDFITEDFDEDNTFDLTNDRWTPGVAGKYVVGMFAFCYGDGGDLDQIGIKVEKNGSALSPAVYTYKTQDDLAGGVHLTCVLESDADDYFEFYVNVNTGSGTPSVSDTRYAYGYKLIE